MNTKSRFASFLIVVLGMMVGQAGAGNWSYGTQSGFHKASTLP